MQAAPSTDLVEADVDAIKVELDKAERRVLFASPFIGHTPGSLMADAISRKVASRDFDARGLTTVVPETLRKGYSSARGIRALIDVCEVRAISNLHAKLIVIDDWALVGSANLTSHGLDGGSLELGIRLNGGAAAEIAKRFDDWWSRYTDVNSRVRIGDLPKRTLVRSEPAEKSTVRPGKGNVERIDGGRALKEHRQVVDLHDALRDLKAGFVDDRRALQPSTSSAMPSRHSEAYRRCRALRIRRITPEQESTAREVLFRVLLLHEKRDARAHAAYRLAHDAPRAKEIPEIKRALRDAYRDDPALNVRRHAYRALRHLGVQRVTYPRL